MKFEFFLEHRNWGQLWVDTNPHPPDWKKVHVKDKLKNSCSQCSNLETITTFWPSKWFSIASVVPEVGMLLLHSYNSWLGNSLCLCLPIWPAEAVLQCCPKCLVIELNLKHLIAFWESVGELLGVIAQCPMTGRAHWNLNSDLRS